MLVMVLIAAAAIAAVFAVIVALRPSEFRIARTAVISAPAAAVFTHVNDFHRWQSWSPYEKLDPAMKRSYEGAAAGVGAVYRWSGNNQAGEGSAAITESRPGNLVRIRLEYLRPFAGTNTAELAFKPVGDRTAVTWSLTGKYNFLVKAVGLFMNMDKVIGGQFEEGLAQLRSVSEAPPRS